METSAMMHIAPELVLPLEEAGDGYARPWTIQALREGWVSAQRQWTKVTADTGVGNPALATAEKGAAYTDACIKNLGTFLVELAAADVDELYEK